MSPNYPRIYGPNAACSMTASAAGKLVIEDFKTEPEFDTLTLNGQVYSGGPELLWAEQSGKSVVGVVTWTSDESVGKNGWKLCLTQD